MLLLERSWLEPKPKSSGWYNNGKVYLETFLPLYDTNNGSIG